MQLVLPMDVQYGYLLRVCRRRVLPSSPSTPSCPPSYHTDLGARQMTLTALTFVGVVHANFRHLVPRGLLDIPSGMVRGRDVLRAAGTERSMYEL